MRVMSRSKVKRHVASRNKAGIPPQRSVERTKKSVGQEIIESLTEAVEILESGGRLENRPDRFTVRTVEMPDDPKETPTLPSPGVPGEGKWNGARRSSSTLGEARPRVQHRDG